MRLNDVVGRKWFEEFKASARNDFEIARSLSDLEAAISGLLEVMTGAERAAWAFHFESVGAAIEHLQNAQGVRCELIEKLVAALPPFGEPAYNQDLHDALGDLACTLSEAYGALYFIGEDASALAAEKRARGIRTQLADLAKSAFEYMESIADQASRFHSLELAEAWKSLTPEQEKDCEEALAELKARLKANPAGVRSEMRAAK